MREIKFRVYSQREKRFFYWGFMWDGFRGFPTNDEFTLEYNKNNSQQYTGLKDKNGKEIYEGDIVKYRFRTKENNEEFISKIFFGEYMWLTDEHSINRINDVEVIGNIYQDKNLLEGENAGQPTSNAEGKGSMAEGSKEGT